MDNRPQQKHDNWMNKYSRRKNTSFEDYTKIIKSNNSLLENINKGVAAISNCSFKEAIKAFNLAIEIGKDLYYEDNLIDECELAKAYLNRGVAYENLNEHENALSDKTESVEMLELICREHDPNDENILALAYMNRGQTYNSMEQYDNALSDAEKSIEIWERLKRNGKSIFEHYLSSAYANKSIASTKIEHWFDEIDDLSGFDKEELAARYTMRGMQYIQKKLYDDAIFDFNKSIEIIEQLSKPSDIIAARAYSGRGMAYFGVGGYERAQPDLSKGINLFEKLQKKGQPIDEIILNQMYIMRGSNTNFENNQINDLDVTYNNSNDAISDYKKFIIEAEKNQKSGKPFDEDRLATAYMGIAQSYDQKEEFEEANRYYDKCIDIWERLVSEGQPLSENSDLATAYMNRGSNYYVSLKIPQALSDINNCINIREQLKKQEVEQDVLLFADSIRTRALIHETLRNYEASIKDYIYCLRILKDEFEEYEDLQERYYSNLDELIEMVKEVKIETLFNNILQEFLYSMCYVPKTEEAETAQKSIFEKYNLNLEY